MDKQQTAVDKLETQIEKLRFQGVTEWQCGYQKALNEVLFLLQQAREKEKEQIINTWIDAYTTNMKAPTRDNFIMWANNYYKKTYGGNK